MDNIHDNDIQYQSSFNTITNNTNDNLIKIKKIENDIININSVIEDVECTINDLTEQFTVDLKEKISL